MLLFPWYLALFHPERYDTTYDTIRDLISEKVVLHIVLVTILGKSELFHIILYLQKKHCLFIIPFKSVVNMNKNNYYYNIFLEKGSYEDKSDYP